MEHAVIAHLRLNDNRFGTDSDRRALSDLEGRLIDAIDKGDAGEFDGDECGEGECVFYMYGSDADRLYSIIEPLLKSSGFNGFAIKRYGEAGDRNALEMRVTW